MKAHRRRTSIGRQTELESLGFSEMLQSVLKCGDRQGRAMELRRGNTAQRVGESLFCQLEAVGEGATCDQLCKNRPARDGHPAAMSLETGLDDCILIES